MMQLIRVKADMSVLSHIPLVLALPRGPLPEEPVEEHEHVPPQVPLREEP